VSKCAAIAAAVETT